MLQRLLKDRVVLVLCALACAGMAWSFWHYLGEDAFSVYTAIVLLALILENRRLRQRLTAGELPPP